MARFQLVLSREEIDPTDKTAKNYVARHARKALGNLDNKRGTFAPDSRFAEELRAYFAGQVGFVELSVEIAEYFADELAHMEKSVSTDVLVVDFEDDADAAVDPAKRPAPPTSGDSGPGFPEGWSVKWENLKPAL